MCRMTGVGTKGLFACVLSAVMLIALHQPSVARDRPGTPKAITADNCSPDPLDYLPRICGTFVVTATEENRTEGQGHSQRRTVCTEREASVLPGRKGLLGLSSRLQEFWAGGAHP